MTVWTDEMCSKLEEYGKLGLCFREAAALLDVTRNAVAGKVIRLGLTWNGRAREAYIKPRRNEQQRLAHALEQRARRAKDRKAKPMAMPEPEIFINGGVSLVDLSDKGCRWISGNLYCGVFVEGRSSFCSRHNALAHRRAA